MAGSSRFVIGLLWHSVNSGNLGVGALSVANIALLRDACAVVGVTPHFIVLGFADPGRQHYVVGNDIEFVPLNTAAMRPGGRFDSAVKRCDYMVDIGGGDSWTDLYGLKRLAFLWWSKWRTMQLGVPLLMAPQTIGPFVNIWLGRLAAVVMKRARGVIARDPQSFSAAQAICPQARLHEMVDVAFALPFTAAARTSDRPIIGINVSGLLFNRGYDGKSSFGMEIDYADYTRQLLSALGQRDEFRISLIAHVNSDSLPIDDDTRIAELLQGEFPFVELAPKFADPIAAKSFISSLDFLVAGRMHACIAAYSAGVAVLPVAYSRKFSGLFEGVLQYPFGVPVKGVRTDKAVALTLEAIDNRAEMASRIVSGKAIAQERLEQYRQLLALEIRMFANV